VALFYVRIVGMYRQFFAPNKKETPLMTSYTTLEISPSCVFSVILDPYFERV
jgi:hypothetical protein